ncbi:MAG: radical SAM protein [Acidobacteriota bacterium]
MSPPAVTEAPTAAGLSTLARRAQRRYEEMELDQLPERLHRDSRLYYYLSVYPSLRSLPALSPEDIDAIEPPKPVRSAYLHVPFCSGVCDFCSYFLVPLARHRSVGLEDYLVHARREIDLHRQRGPLEIAYLYVGGGTPSLLAPDSLDDFLAGLMDDGILRPPLLATFELHPELFHQPEKANHFLDVLQRRGISRVSLGYQSSDEALLERHRRRHDTAFLADAVARVRDRGLYFNLDLMYAMPGQSHDAWEHSLDSALEVAPDSVSTYFLNVDRGTPLHHQVKQGRVQLPSHRHQQELRLMAQLVLEENGFLELPNDFWGRVDPQHGDPDTFRQIQLPSDTHTLPLGPGAYGWLDDTQLCTVFDLPGWRQRLDAGQPGLWRGLRLTAEQRLRRDIMFSFKNDPALDPALFQQRYGTTPDAAFPELFQLLLDLGLLHRRRPPGLPADAPPDLALTPKGRLLVEEIASLFRDPRLDQPAPAQPWEQKLLDKHSFAPSYGMGVGG